MVVIRRAVVIGLVIRAIINVPWPTVSRIGLIISRVRIRMPAPITTGLIAIRIIPLVIVFWRSNA